MKFNDFNKKSMNSNNNQERLISGWTGLVAIILYIGYIFILVKQSKNDEEHTSEQEFPLLKIIIFFSK